MANQSSAHVSCSEELTRTQLLVLRNSQQLDIDCHYVVTNYNRANVGQARILIHATDSSTLSKLVHVQTAHDNLAWSGEYDIDTNRLTALNDNLGNRIAGRYGNEVDRWQWGNTQHTESYVNNATVLSDTFNGIIRGAIFENKAYVDLRIATGNIFSTTWSEGARLYASGATSLLMNKQKFFSNSYVNISQTDSNKFQNGSADGYYLLSNSNGNLFSNDVSENYSYVRMTNSNDNSFYQEKRQSRNDFRLTDSNSNRFYYSTRSSLSYEIMLRANNGLVYDESHNSRSYKYTSDFTGFRDYYNTYNSLVYYYRRVDNGNVLTTYANTFSSSSRIYNDALTGLLRMYYNEFKTITTFRAKSGNQYYNNISRANVRLDINDVAMNSCQVHGNFSVTPTANNTGKGRNIFGQNTIV